MDAASSYPALKTVTADALQPSCGSDDAGFRKVANKGFKNLNINRTKRVYANTSSVDLQMVMAYFTLSLRPKKKVS